MKTVVISLRLIIIASTAQNFRNDRRRREQWSVHGYIGSTNETFHVRHSDLRHLKVRDKFEKILKFEPNISLV